MQYLPITASGLMTNGPLCGKVSPSPALSPSDNVTQYFPHIRSINSLLKVSIWGRRGGGGGGGGGGGEKCEGGRSEGDVGVWVLR